MGAIDLLCLVLALPLIAATTVFVVETALGARPLPAGPAPAAVRRCVVLVPAHDEAAGLAATLTALKAALAPGMEILLVADNCTDATAAIAREAGVGVAERFDAERRGKGFALDHGRTQLAGDPPACVIVLDADTVPRGDALARLADRALASGRPVQGAYTMTARATESAVARFSAASFFIKNVVRQSGGARLGVPAILTGSGMAFPWPVFAALPLATGHVAEDLMLGVRSTLAGQAPLFAADAAVDGASSNDRGTASQRRRWESGFAAVARDHAAALIGGGLARLDYRRLWLGLHLVTPPLILLLALDGVAVLILAVVAALSGHGLAALAILVVLTAAAVAATIAALAGHRRLDLLRDWASIPRYLLWKLGLSLVTIVRRERRWIRTDRD